MQLTTVKSIGIFQKVSHTFAFVWILVNGNFVCRPEFKNITEDVTLSCGSRLPIAEPIVWLFNNHSQVNSSFYRPHGTLVISSPESHDVAVYGDYSCKFANDTALINCFSLYIQGDCSDGCGILTIDSNTTDFYQNSNITFYSTVKANLLAPTADDELGFFIFLKDGDHINNPNRTNHSVITSPNITFYIFNAQFSDGGVYQFKFISPHADLYTNRLSIKINPSSTTTKSIAPTTSVHAAYTMQTTPTPTTDTGQQSPNSTDSKLIGAIVGGVIGAVTLLVVVIAIGIIACKYWRQRHRRHKSSHMHPTPVQNTDEIASTDQTVHLQRVMTVDNIPTGQADEQEHAQFN